MSFIISEFLLQFTYIFKHRSVAYFSLYVTEVNIKNIYLPFKHPQQFQFAIQHDHKRSSNVMFEIFSIFLAVKQIRFTIL
jgi:hypothetical protein